MFGIELLFWFTVSDFCKLLSINVYYILLSLLALRVLYGNPFILVPDLCPSSYTTRRRTAIFNCNVP